MRYFTNFPTTLFQISPPSYRKNPEYVGITDITRNVRFKKEVIDNIALFDYINLTESDTIEILSERLYGSPHYHWVLMLLNDRYDYLNDLPLKQETFEKRLTQLYPAEVITQTYNATMYNLPVDIINSQGLSFDFNQTVESIYYTADNAIITADNAQIRVNTTNIGVNVNSIVRPIRSMFVYDEVLKIFVKRIAFTDVPYIEYYNPTTQELDFEQFPGVKLRYLYDTEVDLNEKKRLIKIISPNLLSTVLQNFKDLL